MLRRSRTILTLVALALAASACNGAGSKGNASPVQTRTTQVAWSARLSPVSQVRMVDGVAVLYITAGRDLDLVGLDPRTGHELWRRVASPSYITPGVSIDVAPVGAKQDLVAFFAPNHAGASYPLYADLVVLDPSTGQDVQRLSGRYFKSTPDRCGAGHRDVCVMATPGGVPFQDVTVNLARGTVRPAALQLPGGARFLSDEVVDLGDRDPETIAGVVNGKLAWRREVGDLFPAGSSSDKGWNFELDEKSGIVWGSIAGPSRVEPGNPMHLLARDESKVSLIGLDRATGKTVWEKPGMSSLCVFSWGLSGRVEGNYRCRETGLLRGTYPHLSYDGVHNVTLERFDPATGTATWSRELDDVPYTAKLALSHDGGVLVATSDGPTVVDLGSGSTRKAGTDETFTCFESGSYRYRDAITIDGAKVFHRSKDELPFACTGNGKAAHGAELRLPDLAGTTDGNLQVVAGPKAVTGFRLG